MSDILIGAIDLYSYKDVAPWIISAKQSGFKGDIYLITYRIPDDVKAKIVDQGVQLYECEHTSYGTAITHQGVNTATQAHNMRFYHAWELLTRLDPTEYRYCIMTDVRDVVFQQNPIDFLELRGVDENKLIASSEGITFGLEEWNKNNLIQGFGSVLYDVANVDKWNVYNVGVVAGDATLMMHLFQTIFAMTEGRFYPSDQSSFNVLLRGAFESVSFFATMYENWAAQMGTTNDPTKQWLWDKLHEPRPLVKNGKVYNTKGELYAIVHQYTRVPELVDIINERYKDI